MLGKLIVHAVDENARAYYNFEGLWTTKTSNVEDNQVKSLVIFLQTEATYEYEKVYF